MVVKINPRDTNYNKTKGWYLKYLLIWMGALFFSTTAMAQLEVLISGGFSGPYKQILPQFERSTGIAVTSLSGASQGSGPKTIKAQLAAGASPDVVILSREGLSELMAAGKIQPGSDVDLATAPLGAAVPTGIPKPDISTVPALKQSLLKIKSIVVPGSTSGIYLTTEVFPHMGIADQITVKVTERGSEATALLAAKEVGIAIQPSSELANVPGIDYIGPLPKEVQLIQTFAAAIVKDAKHSESASKLIQLLSSPIAAQAIQHWGMNTIQR